MDTPLMARLFRKSGNHGLLTSMTAQTKGYDTVQAFS
jgi:hypothetical protein